MKITVSAGALLLFAALLLILPLKWLIGALLAACFHEFCHFLAVWLVGGNIRCIQIGIRGAVMQSDPLPPGKELLCTLAGPLGSLSLLFLARWMPRTAICGGIQGLFNLLPLLPLDGGCILRSLLYSVLSPPVAGRVFRGIQWVVGLILVCFLFRFPLIPVFFLLPRLLFGGTIREISRKRYGYDRITETNPASCAEACPVHRR